MRCLRLSGTTADLAHALDLLHVHAEVLGVVERENELEVGLVDAPLPELPGVRIVELPAGGTTTGLEQDCWIRVADDLVVRPPWVASPVDFAGIELVVPRGMAFGSGEHASTQAALALLHRTWRPGTVGCTDVGTGSGILLAYAAARGCMSLCGCDLEAEAVAAARELLPAAVIVHGGPERLTMRTASVVANLTGAELGGCLAAILRLWDRQAPLVLAGMRAEEVAPIARRVPAVELAREERAGFTALAFAPAD